ncbi:hypothetical protein P4S95_03245 [Aneurinibacillus aneurinilyticus]|uniref:hypothetical protein n=1 Tax=Aneurinibacillus aneurinilyticus TaxID=1391 RepID=UPI002E1E3B39|nr:hypothetical protein [Aneurinibacillus aneurinilyticus]
MIIHKVEERRCMRRRIPSSFSYKEETRPLAPQSGPLSLGTGDEPTPVWGTVWWRSILAHTG